MFDFELLFEYGDQFIANYDFAVYNIISVFHFNVYIYIYTIFEFNLILLFNRIIILVFYKCRVSHYKYELFISLVN